MTYQEKLEAVKAKIVEIIPSIMDLTFGCKIKYKDLMGDYVNGIFILDNGNEIGRYAVKTNINFIFINDFEILGRNITLEDVLKVLTQKDNYKKATKNNKLAVIDVIDNWILGKPLHDQSKEMINFLYEILCQNKH